MRRTALTRANLRAVDAVALLTPHDVYDLEWVRKHALPRLRRPQRTGREGRHQGGDPVSLVAPEDTAASATYRRAAGVLWRDTGMHVLVLRAEVSDSPVVLGGGHAQLWRMVGGGGRSVPELAAAFAASAPDGVDVTTAGHSALSALRELASSRGSIQMVDRGDRGTYPADLRAIAAFGLAGTLLGMPPEPLDERVHPPARSGSASEATGLLWAAIREGAFPATERRPSARRSRTSKLSRVSYCSRSSCSGPCSGSTRWASRCES